MKAINIMNFVRQIDERLPKDSDVLYQTTCAELELVNEFGYENTFLLQYDAYCDERYIRLFKDNATDRTELGIWYEIVEPLTSACGLPYKSEMGWKWDWHIVPGFSMAYTPREREMLIDEAMRKFREVFGYYPRTVASWVIDTHTLNYLAEHYDIDAVGICRDQTSTDAYTLVGGYFNQAYYPSKSNIFTPAQSEEYKTNIPVFRLLGSCPVHNYDGRKYVTEKTNEWLGIGGCFTLEPVWKTGASPECVDWFFKTYFENEDLGFSYAQLGQENSFGVYDFVPALRMQLEKLRDIPDVSIQKMGDTGAWFKRTYTAMTPPTSVVATDAWDTELDVQSVYYDSKNYMANLFRYGSQVFIRALYLFDERVSDRYLTERCDTFDAVYENLPIVDTFSKATSKKTDCGILIDADAAPFTVRKICDGALALEWEGHAVSFYEDRIEIKSPELTIYTDGITYGATVTDDGVEYEYKGARYSLEIENATVKKDDKRIKIYASDGACTLRPRRSK